MRRTERLALRGRINLCEDSSVLGPGDTLGDTPARRGQKTQKGFRRAIDGTLSLFTSYFSGGHGIRTHNPLRGT